ncbi:hypothetical protein CTI14_67190, partial [Methylobacterium radiotolerans]
MSAKETVARPRPCASRLDGDEHEANLRLTSEAALTAFAGARRPSRTPRSPMSAKETVARPRPCASRLDGDEHEANLRLTS